MNVRVLPLQAKWQFLEPLHPGNAGASPNRVSTDWWFIGRSKLMVMASLVPTLVASRPGEMLTIRGGFSAHAEARGANTARTRRTERRMPPWKVSEIFPFGGPA